VYDAFGPRYATFSEEDMLENLSGRTNLYDEINWCFVVGVFVVGKLYVCHTISEFV